MSITTSSSTYLVKPERSLRGELLRHAVDVAYPESQTG